MKIVVAIDAYKGCLTSDEVEQVVAEALRECSDGCQVVTLPVADGGEGTLQVMARCLGAQWVEVEAHDALMRGCRGHYAVTADGRVALMEMAEVAGLPMLSVEERNPWRTSTYGVGELVRDALRRGCRRVVMGIGGSATNDAGVGMLEALGYRFYDAQGRAVRGCGATLGDIVRWDDSGVCPTLRETTFTVACDVNCPFCGRDGAAYVFAAQKGADAAMVQRLDEGMAHWADCMAAQGLTPVRDLPGSGAAGGLGGGMVAFLHAELRPGADLLLEMSGLEGMLAEADLVITGEGHMDGQTLMGKLPARVLAMAKRHGVPVVALAGRIDERTLLREAGFAGLYEVSPREMALETAMLPEVARENIWQAVPVMWKAQKK